MNVKEARRILGQLSEHEEIFVQANADGQVGIPLKDIDFVEELNAVVMFPDWELYFKRRAEKKLAQK